ncbi:DoxX family protein [Cellulomonas oligotrophica]|uniref:Membrane protein n=1 Tax=Cellulomonas oligotrophica TaxID=931536 RepID=A0A7Y9FIB4_9CELL|nr:DoxX family membrane protein [Cellulomonas oligotrophica]NYD87881.1 putative membrane protein [Cellulomonas oligotrophica]GIG32912.1 membrane protein [Cellulomonas oligotrophica]
MSTTSTAPSTRDGVARTVGRVWLGLTLAFAGTTHLTVARQEFQAQVPSWVPLDPDLVVLASGVVEITLGLALTFAPRRWRPWVGAAAALFFVAIFPGNVAQYLEQKDGFGLDTDAKRLARLPFQVVLVLWSLWSTGAWRAFRAHRAALAARPGDGR